MQKFAAVKKWLGIVLQIQVMGSLSSSGNRMFLTLWEDLCERPRCCEMSQVCFCDPEVVIEPIVAQNLNESVNSDVTNTEEIF